MQQWPTYVAEIDQNANKYICIWSKIQLGYYFDRENKVSFGNECQHIEYCFSVGVVSKL